MSYFGSVDLIVVSLSLVAIAIEYSVALFAAVVQILGVRENQLLA